jgi:hypothetical protein
MFSIVPFGSDLHKFNYPWVVHALDSSQRMKRLCLNLVRGWILIFGQPATAEPREIGGSCMLAVLNENQQEGRVPTFNAILEGLSWLRLESRGFLNCQKQWEDRWVGRIQPRNRPRCSWMEDVEAWHHWLCRC